MPLTVLLSITTSYHQTVAAAPLQPTTPLSLVLIYQLMAVCVPLLYRLWSVEISQVLKVTQSVSLSTLLNKPARAQISILHPTDNEVIHNSDTTEIFGNHNSDTNIVYMISISSLATALIVSTVVFITVIVIILTRSKAKTKAAHEQSNRAEGTIHDEPMYEDVTGPSPSVNVIDTQANIAYGHAQTITTTT